MPPYQGGGDMIELVTFEKTTYREPPARFEAGTPPIVQAIGLGAAIDYVDAIGIENIAAHEAAILDYATDAISNFPGVTIIGQADNKAGIVSFIMDDVHPHDIGTIIDSEGVAVRGRPSLCAALDAAIRSDRDGAGFIRDVHQPAGYRCAHSRARSGQGDFRLMDDDLRELYQEVILDHGKNPRNFRHPEDASHEALGNNPLCGDRLQVFAKVNAEGVIEDAAFEGRGCAISVASASMMTDIVRGKTTEEVDPAVQRLSRNVHHGGRGNAGGVCRRCRKTSGPVRRSAVSHAGEVRHTSPGTPSNAAIHGEQESTTE